MSKLSPVAWLCVGSMVPVNTPRGELPRSRDMYMNFIRIALPSVMEMVLISLINMMDTVMVSSVGTDAVAAVGLVGQPRMLMLCFFFALNTGITAVVARRKGEDRQDDANTVVRNSIVIILLLSAVLMAILLPLARPLMIFAGAEEGRTLEDSIVYFLIVGAALPFNAVAMGICAAQRGVGNTRLTMYVNVASNLVNILFNWLLINGIGPFPRLEVTGAAIATAIGLFAGMILSLLSLFRGRKSIDRKDSAFLRVRKGDIWKLQRLAVNDVMRVAVSAMVEQVALRIGFFAYAKIVAGLGTDAFTAHQIDMQFLNLSFSFADGLGIAGTALVGQMLGKKRQDLAHIYGTLAQRFALIISLILGAFCILCRGMLVSMFINPETAAPAVQPLAEDVMVIVGIFQPFQMISVVASGALRGAGDVKYTAKVMAITVTVMRPVLAILAVWLLQKYVNTEIALLGCWAASLADMVTRAILFMRRYRKGEWHNIKV